MGILAKIRIHARGMVMKNKGIYYLQLYEVVSTVLFELSIPITMEPEMSHKKKEMGNNTQKELLVEGSKIETWEEAKVKATAMGNNIK